MMFGGMLVGAWLLIHGQCCVNADIDNRNRSPLVDPLARRSPLEKNFMRFGRSSTTPPQLSLPFTTKRFQLQNDRYGRSIPEFLQDFDNGKLLRSDRAKDNFMRFGRNNEYDIRTSRSNNNFMRFGRAKDNFLRFGKSNDNLMRFDKGSDFMRFGRGNDNFMRFGRMNDDPNDEIISRERRDKALIRLGRQRQSEKNDNFMRFGRSLEDIEEKESRKLASANDDIMKTKECSGNECDLPNSKVKSYPQEYCPPFLDPNVIIAPEFSLLPKISSPLKRKSSNRSDNFLRLG